jgi:hypothetical protein
MKNLGERYHSEFVTLLCLLAAMHPTGTLLPVIGADVDPSISFSNISTTARWTSPPQSANKGMTVTAASGQQKNHSVPNKTAELIPGMHDASYRGVRDTLHPLSNTAQKDALPHGPQP